MRKETISFSMSTVPAIGVNTMDHIIELSQFPGEFFT